MDIIFIEQLTVFTTIGIYDWEQIIQQKLLIDIKIGNNKKITVKNYSNGYYLDYAQISKLIIKHIESQKFMLIEHVAQKISEIILNKFDCSWVKVKVCKPSAIARAKQVSVIIKRTK
ncbi:Dihydroneopterin aldolase [Candidatus Arsenophonus lipoptenae]|uniref:Dihydroneopterin aldolase n=1 Tax=Candidatus Arsenophonus lipoptenae TaxID=634113 RepID=A0A0X8CY41_9GAMM|nr:FolB domain-containing protein [Candidatus Arsenophonus lipoptenae]AMA65022.1 Dihydroneopterin aldolase [Candidatus Arsenophonus lipoptenae]